MNINLNDNIQAILDASVRDGGERGVQVAIYLNGKLEVDAWAGITDLRTGAPVDGDSIFPVFSTTKGVFSTVLHILAERGELDYDRPIADYWPEFAAHGKEGVTVRHALTHQSGLPFMPEPVTLEEIANWDGMCQRMADMPLAWPAGSRSIYHPVTFGWLVGEVACRITGRTVPQLLEEEICRPLGMTRMFCGIPANLEPQTAFLEDNHAVGDPGPPPHDVVPNMRPLHEWINRPIARCTPQPGCSGIMSARDVARHYAALLPGGVDGIELLPPGRVKLATEIQVPQGGLDPNDGARRGLGYMLDYGDAQRFADAPGFGHPGHGGSSGFAYPKYNLAIAFTRNRYGDEPTMARVWKEIDRALGVA